MTVRVLVTGFTPFPGAPVNPTEHLIGHFERHAPRIASDAAFRFAVLPVEYGSAVEALEEAAGTFDPHVAIHFGLADEAAGFRLERLARNAITAPKPDNTGRLPEAGEIFRGGGPVRSTLPLDEMAETLRALNLPVEWSDDAGGYLCNYVFYHSAAALCRRVRAVMSGFVHVGPVALPGDDARDDMLDFAGLVAGAEAILSVCAARMASAADPD
ncbi:hypothetical protein [Oricola sp.]|uniref:pyroglutamyl-peptidase I family protein n=1 Tax=Oricola sp. TaxID=1979950 RepID=UPI003BACC49F